MTNFEPCNNTTNNSNNDNHNNNNNNKLFIHDSVKWKGDKRGYPFLVYLLLKSLGERELVELASVEPF